MFSLSELLDIAKALAITDVDEFGHLEEKVNGLIANLRMEAVFGKED